MVALFFSEIDWIYESQSLVTMIFMSGLDD